MQNRFSAESAACSTVLSDAPKISSLGKAKVLSIHGEQDGILWAATRFAPEGAPGLAAILKSFEIPADVPLREADQIYRMRLSELSRCRHQNLLAAREFGFLHGSPYINYSAAAGAPLGTRRPKSVVGAVKLLIRLSTALDVIHASSVYHGRIGIGSVYISETGRAHLSGFGLQYALAPLLAGSSSASMLSGAYPEKKVDLRNFVALAGTILSQVPNGTEAAVSTFESIARTRPGKDIGSAYQYIVCLARELGVEPLSLSFDDDDLDLEDTAPTSQNLVTRAARARARRPRVPTPPLIDGSRIAIIRKGFLAKLMIALNTPLKCFGLGSRPGILRPKRLRRGRR